MLLGEVGSIELMDGAYSSVPHGRTSGLSAWQP
jgi:hypothetical protein